ncbi:hypothetical protein ASPFODRAFT_403533 [Aspergillus luchuensis CBS 106.47]|uniref:Uncharacterized protein n=1 Tax=Aspergillus luchuensis (strain CBS 106.47) TaxID=1137211 RepID=A0A1M3T1Q9_ASPLC|nr:hypothetical protein ASPFODRAFT_403533 [Aspergillus luchuensis CBS 106.47]
MPCRQHLAVVLSPWSAYGETGRPIRIMVHCSFSASHATIVVEIMGCVVMMGIVAIGVSARCTLCEGIICSILVTLLPSHAAGRSIFTWQSFSINTEKLVGPAGCHGVGREDSLQVKRITERASAIDSWGPRFGMQE